MDCPLFTARDEPIDDELKSYACPIVHCLPNNGSGNFTFSMCRKTVNERLEEDLYNLQFIDKDCLTDYDFCESSCAYLQSEAFEDIVREKYHPSNSTTYLAVGCVQGDYSSTVNNASSFFPPASIVQSKIYPGTFYYFPYATLSSSTQLQSSITFPWFFLAAVLLLTHFTK